MKIALAQIVSTSDLDANLDLVEHYTARAVADRAELIIFPEATMRSFGHSLVDIAEPADGPWATRLRGIAQRHAITVVAGMFTPGADGKVTNTLIAHGPGVDDTYDKIHLFDAFGFQESDTVQPGDRTVLIDVAGLRIGLSTCYDVRFPSLYTRLADQGAQLICVAASWGAGPTKIDQWELLVRARALDSTTFIAACGQADPTTAGVETRGSAPTGVGHSLLVGPDGQVLDRLGPEPGLLVADVDPALIEETRRVLPVLANRRW